MRFAGPLVMVVALLGACGGELPQPSPTPQATAGAVVPLSRFDGYWFSFEYPTAWGVISEHEQCGIHGPTVAVAVGIGSIDLQAFPPVGPGDHPRPMTEVGPATVTATVYCPATPNWSVPDTGVVVAYHSGATCCPTPPQPRPALASGEEFVEVDGVEAILSQSESGLLWYFFCGGPEFCGGAEFIEGRWGRLAGDEVKEQVRALVESWTWHLEQANSNDWSN